MPACAYNMLTYFIVYTYNIATVIDLIYVFMCVQEVCVCIMYNDKNYNLSSF